MMAIVVYKSPWHAWMAAQKDACAHLRSKLRSYGITWAGDTDWVVWQLEPISRGYFKYQQRDYE